MSPPPPPRRDKFAALAQHQQEKSQQQQEEAELPGQPQMELPPPDAAEIEVVEVDAEAPAIVHVQPAPAKQDKFASMAARRSGETPPSTPPTPAAPTAAPSGIADADAATAAISTTIDNSNVEVLSAPEPPSVVAAAPRRDKFSAMASRQQTGAGATSDADATMTTAVVVTLDQSQEEAAKERNRLLQQRMDQRDNVWSDLCKAEAQTIQLLQTAQTTATHLAAAASYSSSTDNDADATAKASSGEDAPASRSQVAAIQKCMKDYQSTVEQIHKLLAPHADLVKAYQAPTRLNRMYQARVELRLADEKKQLLSEFLRLQKEEEETAATTVTPVTAATGGGAAAMEGLELDTSKRKREDE
jgi:hypothetical protein